jgi:rod shape determining protein RodA
MSLYTLLAIHLMSLNFKFKKDYFLKTMTTSVSFMIFIYMSINIAMTIALAPVVGVPLPFFSYGGSSFITFIVIFGILENLFSFQYDTMYSKIKYK